MWYLLFLLRGGFFGGEGVFRAVCEGDCPLQVSESFECLLHGAQVFFEVVGCWNGKGDVTVMRVEGDKCCKLSELTGSANMSFTL